MSRVCKGLLVGLLMALAVFAGAKFALWFTVRQAVDDGIARLSPAARIRYAGISSSLGGRVGLRDLRVEIPLLDDELRIAHLELEFDSLGELLEFRQRLQEGQLPERFALSLQGVQLDARGEIIRLGAAAARRRLAAIGLGALSAPACGDGQPVDTADLLAMGVALLRGDLRYSHRLDPLSHRLAVAFEGHSDAFGTARLQATLDDLPDERSAARLAAGRLSHARLELLDNPYPLRLQAYCAARHAGDPAALRDAEVQRLDGLLRSQGVAVGGALLEGYRRYLEAPRQLRIEITPSAGVVWGALALFKAQDVLAMLKPRVTVNRQPVQPIGFEWLRDPPAAPNRPQPEGLAGVPRAPGYQYVSVDSLPGHAGRRLQLVTVDGTYYQGVLRKVENDRACLDVQIGNASADVFLRLNKIDKVRVLF